ncbi:C2 family cysteine protease [Schaalia hyovaginalis]|uniref:Uncharacterized protein YukE n=1 Tax=Schaalia hyovaginalis TaxID=29316 RepID=A0A923E5I8_9ACTO|nr:C2 family cysteine protease [Schaalia hyovaginalis]MBB6333944.1 uncharacterized protein YukE [Schaalia hyovaginalis]
MITIFSSMVADAPGDANVIYTLASSVRDAKTKLEAAETSFASQANMAPNWEGQARDAYENSFSEMRRRTAALTDGTGDGATSLEIYAGEIASTHSAVEALQTEMQRMDQRLEEADPADRSVLFYAMLPSAFNVAGEYRFRIGHLKQAATTCAAELREALHLETVAVDNEGNPTSASDRRGLRPDEIDAINAQLKGGDISYRDVNQGAIGDCYYLSALMALMNTDEGDDWLRSCITPHYAADGTIDGYLVTVYDDPLHPDASASQTVLVRDIYANGVKGDDGEAGIATLFEAAYGQIHPQGVGGAGGKGNDIWGGWPEEALEDVTGEDATTVNSGGQGVFGWGAGYSHQEQQQIIDALDNGQPVATETATGAGSYDKDGQASVNVTVDGQPETIRLYDGHAYMVVDADENGVVLCNPHGSNPIAGGGATDDGEFRMSWEDYGTYFGSTSMGRIP